MSKKVARATVSDTLAHRIFLHIAVYMEGVEGQIIALLRKKNGGKQIKGTKLIVSEALGVDADCRVGWIQKNRGIALRIVFGDEGLEKLREMYDCGVELGDEIDVICQGQVIPNFAANSGPKIFLLADESGLGRMHEAVLWEDLRERYQSAARTIRQTHRMLGADVETEEAVALVVEHAKSLMPPGIL